MWKHRLYITIAAIALLMLFNNSKLHAQCVCTAPIPPCRFDDCLPSNNVTNGQSNIIVPRPGFPPCNAIVFWCARNLSGSACALNGYEVACEYKIQKVCFPPDCEINCEGEEFNSILQSIVMRLARMNPSNHFVPTSNQWHENSYKTAWRLGFPACFVCEIDPQTNCTTLVPCGNSTCYKWYKTYTCNIPNCPTIPPAEPPCASADCGNGVIQFVEIQMGKTVNECQNQNCILCGYTNP